MMTGAERANLAAAGRQLTTNLSLVLSRSASHADIKRAAVAKGHRDSERLTAEAVALEAEAATLRADWLALGAALDRDDAAVIRPLLEKHDLYLPKGLTHVRGDHEDEPA